MLPHSHHHGLLRSEILRCGPKLETEEGPDRTNTETKHSALHRYGKILEPLYKNSYNSVAFPFKKKKKKQFLL